MIIYCSHSQSLPNVKLSGNLPISHSMPNFVALFILFLLHRKYTQDTSFLCPRPNHDTDALEKVNNMIETIFQKKAHSGWDLTSFLAPR